jgi:transmembrane sensor
LLSDGTRIILGPASRLAVSPAFGNGAREVTVDGVAFLAVRHDDARPFTVRAGAALVRDVGTQFTVRTGDRGAGQQGVTVTVEEGQVELRAASSSMAPVTLSAGDRGDVDTDGRVTAARGGAGEEDLAWIAGRLVFRGAPLGHVQSELRRWYGVELHIADSSLRARRITAAFDRDPVDRVLRVIALALGAEVERRDSVAILRKGAAR